VGDRRRIGLGAEMAGLRGREATKRMLLDSDGERAEANAVVALRERGVDCDLGAAVDSSPLRSRSRKRGDTR